LTLKTGALSVLSYPPNTTSNNYQVSKTFSYTYKEKEEENTLIVYEKILKNLDDTPNRYARVSFSITLKFTVLPSSNSNTNSNSQVGLAITFPHVGWLG